MAYCTYSFGTPSTSYDGASAPMASTTAQRWPLAQAQVSRPAVCYKSTTGTLVGIGNQPPNCAYAATHFAAPRSSGRYHNGIDLFAPAGTPVYATEPGKVALVMSNFYNGLPAVCVSEGMGWLLLVRCNPSLPAVRGALPLPAGLQHAACPARGTWAHNGTLPIAERCADSA